ncbi:mCG1041180, partial [Mus musculus]
GSAPSLEPKAEITGEVLPPSSHRTGPASFHACEACRTLHKSCSCRESETRKQALRD